MMVIVQATTLECVGKRAGSWSVPSRDIEDMDTCHVVGEYIRGYTKPPCRSQWPLGNPNIHKEI